MEVFHKRMFIFNLCFMGFIACSNGATVIIDGFTNWKNPTIFLGDSIIFRNKFHYNLYIYNTRSDFNLCNFTHATLLSNPKSSSYIWHSSRLGYFYFSLKPCKPATKVSIKVVSQLSTTAAPPPTPAPASGGVPWSSPDFPWPFLPHEKSGGPMNSPGPIGAAMPPDGMEGGFPFIDSSPVVPLPASEIDSGTIFHLPISAIVNVAQKMERRNVVGYLILQSIFMVSMM